MKLVSHQWNSEKAVLTSQMLYYKISVTADTPVLQSLLLSSNLFKGNGVWINSAYSNYSKEQCRCWELCVFALYTFSDVKLIIEHSMEERSEILTEDKVTAYRAPFPQTRCLKLEFKSRLKKWIFSSVLWTLWSICGNSRHTWANMKPKNMILTWALLFHGSETHFQSTESIAKLL